MRGLSQLFSTILTALGIHLNPWVAASVIAGILVLIYPSFARNHRSKQARRWIQRSAQESRERRLALQAEALEMVKDDPHGLIAVVEEALRRGMKPLAEQALGKLKATGQQTALTKKLERELYGDAPKTAEGEAMAIERLLSEGQLDAAKTRYEAAIKRWPDAPALRELQPQLRPGDQALH